MTVRALGSLLVCFVLCTSRAFAANINVTNTNDSGPGSLRDAVTNAQPGDVISFSVGGTVTLSSTPLTINTSLTINGPGSSSLAFDGKNGIQQFVIGSGATVTILGVTLQNANNVPLYYSGAILNYGTLMLSNVVLTGNSGPAILNFASGTVMLSNSALSGNTSYAGGGLDNLGGTVSIVNTTISGNFASTVGGGLNNQGSMTIVNSTIANNTAGFAGGALSASTYGTTVMINATIANNSAPYGAGLFNYPNDTPMTLKNSILATNQGRNCGATIVSAGHNVSDDGGCAFSGTGDLNNISAGLDPGGLKNNGGPTSTIGLLTNSAALNAIPVSPTNYCTLLDGVTPISTDQRGVLRRGTACDIGSFEASVPDDDSAFAQLNGANTFNGNQTVNGAVAVGGMVTATSFVGNGSGLFGVNAATAGTATYATSAGSANLAANAALLGGVAPANYARLDVGNAFVGSQNIAGNINQTGNFATNGTLAIGGGTAILQHLSMMFNPNFPALKPSACSTLAFAFNGLADGDTLALGVPSARLSGGGVLQYFAWVSASNTVTIRACNIDPGSPQKTAGTGAIRVDAWKH